MEAPGLEIEMPMAGSERSHRGLWPGVGFLRHHPTNFSASLSQRVGKTLYTLCLHIPTSHHIPKLLFLNHQHFPGYPINFILSFSLYTSQKHLLLLTLSCIPSPHLSSMTLHYSGFPHFFSKNDSSLLCGFMLLSSDIKDQSFSRLIPRPSFCVILSS